MSRSMCSWLVLAIVAIGCGDDDGVPARPDGGVEADGGGGDAGMDDGGTDAGETDTTAPTVIATLPRDEATEVDPATAIRVTFSEAIDAAAGGTVEVTAD